mmetsp:Transcript_50558/g.83798  ORF Transcript_50558/g.83798 Transcript_50558/m.83798 type:complete len:745 (+) Transcript_50558:46-2280(+)
MSNCFKKEFKVTTQSLMGKADVKKLRSQLLADFPRLTKKLLDQVLSDKEDVTVLKCSNGTTLYVPSDGAPAFFDDGFGGTYPTLTTLWRLPPIMPELVTHAPVSKFLLPRERSAGSDMMLPGVIPPEEGWHALGLEVNQKRCIRVQGNAMPFAIGKILVSNDEVDEAEIKGKAMAVLHVYRDSLWTYSGRKLPNNGFLAEEVVASEGDAPSVNMAAPEVEVEEDDEEDEEHEEEEADEEPMDPDSLLEYCFFAALKTSCTDAELPISADKFYSHHMQPARPGKQPALDAKKTSYKQIGKFIKAMHKAKHITVREVKNNITILSVDRGSAAYTSFEVRDGASKAARVSNTDALVKEEELVALRTKPPVVTDLWQPNSYTKPLFSEMGCDAKNDYFTIAEAHRVLERYVHEKLSVGNNPCATGATEDSSVSDATAAAAAPSLGVSEWLRSIGFTADDASRFEEALASDGFDSLRALRAGDLTSSDLVAHGMSEQKAQWVLVALFSELSASLIGLGIPAQDSSRYAEALSSDGFDSVRAVQAMQLSCAEFEQLGLRPADAKKMHASLVLGEKGGASVQDCPDEAASSAASVIDESAVPIDDMLLNSLIKLAGGQKKGATFPSHLPLSELKAKIIERMTPFHKVVVEGEAPLIKKGSLKLISIETKRAAGHNKTHVAGLESFLVSPDAVAQALKIKLGCTTAVLKLPGNNVKEQEVLLQGHCVTEVVDYLREVYCIEKKWLITPKPKG